MAKKEKLDKEKEDFLKWLEEDPFGLEEEIKVVMFKCIDCGKKDEVPEYVVEEFGFDLGENDEVEVLCPFCGGTMRQARNVPRD